MPTFLTSFAYYFIVLLAALVGIKIFLVAIRIRSGKWPASPKFLLEIVEWRVEAKKVTALAITALLITVINYLISS